MEYLGAESLAVYYQPSTINSRLFMPQGFDGVEAGGAAGGHEAEEDADGGGKEKGDAVDLRIEQEGCADELCEPDAEAVSKRDAAEAADAGEGDGFDQELEHHLAGTGTDGHPDADLAGSFGDRDQHDVHDADAADQQADAGDCG